jgi:hypothetical protein
MQISRLPALTGWRWVIEGFRILGRQPVALLSITFINLMLMGLSLVVPLVGSMGPLLLTPAFMVGMMRAARMADAGQNPSPLVLFSGFKEQQGRAWRPLLILGVINAVTTMIALSAATMAGGELLVEMATGRISPADPRAADAPLGWAALVFLVIYLPVQLATWYAPMFIAWDGIPLTKAMFFSIAAILRNKAAFLIYAGGWFLVALVGMLVLRIVQGLIGGSPMLMTLVLYPVWLGGLAAVYCSFWATYRDAVDHTGSSRATDSASHLTP